MKKKLSPYFIDLAQDACLKSYWRKEALRTFLSQHGVTQNFLLSWKEDETKANFLRRMFSALVARKDLTGHKVILNMASSLVEMKSFTDLTGWPDSHEKIQNAHRAVEKLKIELNKLNDQLSTEKIKEETIKKSQEERTKSQIAIQTLEKFQLRLQELLKDIGSQNAGYSFEEWLYEFAVFHDILARKSYRDKDNRQIDGSLTIDGVTFLLEAKFTRNPVGSQDIDVFFNKVRKKADNTMGLMVSINGFLPDAINTASCDRTFLILLDGSHFFNIIFQQKMTFKEAITRIQVHASQTGCSYLSAKEFGC